MRITYFLSVLLVIFSCSGNRHNFTVEVSVNNADNSLLYLARRTLTETIVVDSALPDKSGRYVMEGYASQPDFYIVYQNPQRYINLVIHPGDDFKVLTDAASFDLNYLVEGSKDSRLIQKMVNMRPERWRRSPRSALYMKTAREQRILTGSGHTSTVPTTRLWRNIRNFPSGLLKKTLNLWSV